MFETTTLIKDMHHENTSTSHPKILTCCNGRAVEPWISLATTSNDSEKGRKSLVVVGIPMSWAISDAHSPQRKEGVGNDLLESSRDLGGKWSRVMDINAWCYYSHSCACLNQGLPGYMSYESYTEKSGGGLTFRTCEQNHYPVHSAQVSFS